MFNISNYFQKFLNARNREIGFRMIVQKVLKEQSGVEVHIKDISIKGAVIYLKNISQAARSALFIKKQLLIDTFNKEQGTYIIKDIR